MARLDQLKLAINFIGFQAIWLASVVGAAKHNLYFAYGFFFVFLIWQLWPTNRAKGDCWNLLALLLLGFLLDSIWALSGLIQYQSHISWFNTAPNWILILWVTFALTLNHSMAWIYAKPKLALAFGAIGGPISYLAAERIGAITMQQKPLTLFLLSIAWGLVLWVCLKLRSSIKSSNSRATAKTEAKNYG